MARVRYRSDAVEKTQDQLREAFRLAYRRTLEDRADILIVMLVAAKQDAMIAGVTIREIQDIQYAERLRLTNQDPPI